MDPSNNAETEPGPSKKVKFHVDNLISKDAHDDVRVLTVKNLSEDELAIIFSSYWITTNDLLNFRLVNKIWRNAATTTLLQRDACYVALKTVGKDYSRIVNQSGFYKLEGEKISSKKLNHLTDLMSKSPKFPASTFHIHTLYDSYKLYTDYTELSAFFKLHGEKIKRIHPHGRVSEKLLLDIFFIHTPNLECLDLSEAQLLHSKKNSKSQENDLQWISKILPIKSLSFGNIISNHTKSDNFNIVKNTATYRKIIHLLLTLPSKLSRIENVTLDTLPDILREGKGHLITSFKYIYSRANSSESLLIKFLETNPNLSAVTLNMNGRYPWSSADAVSLNSFIESFKDTVQKLELYFMYDSVIWDPRLEIPPMKNLKSLTLEGYYDENEIGLRIDELKTVVFKFQDKILAKNYFPNLMEVRLSPQGEITAEANLMSFFKCKFNQNRTDWGSFPRVESLEIVKDTKSNISLSFDKRTAELSQELFPNIRYLKIKCGDIKNLDSVLWKISRKVEFMEIYGISSVPKNMSSTTTSTDLSLFVDKFFTGFSLDMCRKLRTTQLPQETKNPDMLKFIRLTPSICELHYLRELKLRFSSKLYSEFASQVTGTYAFLKMPNTKFIISYNPKMFESNIHQDKFNDIADANEIGEDAHTQNTGEDAEELYFGSIKPYVKIAYEKN